MANIGTLGKSSLTANTDTSVYTVSVGNVATININVVNTTSTAATVRIGITSSGSLTLADYIEYDAALPANGVLERTGVVIGSQDTVYVRSSVTGTVARVYGFEESAI